MGTPSPEQVAALEAIYDALGPLRLRYCPLRPTPRQEAFLLLPNKEVFFGGAAGGGKSVALLMAALQYADVPGYHALLLRPSLTELQLPGALIELSRDWLTTSKAQWSGDTKLWRFPGPGRRSGSGGASVGFGYLSEAGDLGRYHGTSYSFLGFDELTRFNEAHYRRMFRVLRQPDPGKSPTPAASDGTRLDEVPVRVRAASNPGGPGHSWVKTRFVDPASRHPGVIFLPSRLTDNPYLDQHTYQQTLSELPAAERARLLHGDWEIPDDGDLFQRDWFKIIDRAQLPARTRAVRYWDLAGTEPSPSNRDPDYSVGLRLELDPKSGDFYLPHLVRARKAPGAIERLVAATADQDGDNVNIVIEQEPGASGVALIDRYKRHVLRGYAVRGCRETGPKDVRARPVAAAAENGLITLVRGPHLHEFLDELCAFPNGSHDDCVDALAGAHKALAKTGNPMTIHPPKGRIPGIPDRNCLTPNQAALDPHHDPLAQLAAQLGIPLYNPRTPTR